MVAFHQNRPLTRQTTLLKDNLDEIRGEEGGGLGVSFYQNGLPIRHDALFTD